VKQQKTQVTERMNVEDWVVLLVDEFGFHRRIGEHIRVGDTLGCFEGHPVRVPFDATIDNVMPDDLGNRLFITLIQEVC
jgi:hypothetical protein